MTASLGTSLVLQLVGTITGVILARSLGVTDRGQLAAAVLWPQVVGALATLGIQESVTFHVARAPDNAGEVLGSGLALWVIQSLVFTAVCAALLPIVLSKHTEATIISAFIYLLYIPANAISLLLVGILNGLERYGWFNLVRLLVGILILVAQTVLLLTGAMAVRSMVIAYVVCYLVTAAFAALLVARAHPSRIRYTRLMLRSILAYGLRSHASTTSATLNAQLDVLVISIFLSSRNLGLYVIAVALTSVTVIVGVSVAYVALPSLAKCEPGPDRTLLARRFVAFTMILSAALAAPVIILAPQLIVLFFGAAFRPATEVTRVLLLAGIGFSTTRALEAVLRAVNRPLDAGIAEFIALGATFASLAILLPLIGLLGAGLSSLLAYMTAGTWMTMRAARVLGTSRLALLLPDRADLAWASARVGAVARRPWHTRKPS